MTDTQEERRVFFNFNNEHLRQDLSASFLPRLLLSAVLLCFLVSLRADIVGPRSTGDGKTTPTDYAPVVDNIGVRVERGARSEFDIDATSQSVGYLQFLIRTRPEAGVLEGPFRIEGEPHRARFRYTAPSGEARDQLEFTYAARVPGGKFSSTAKVTLFLTEPKAKLVLPKSTDLGRVVAGSTGEGRLKVTNAGKASWRGPVTTKAPFAISPVLSTITLAPGQTTEIPVRFSPEREGKVQGAIVFGPENDRQAALIEGEAYAPFDIEPVELVLQADRDGIRQGEATLSNPTGRAAQILLNGGERIKVPASIIVPASGSVQVPISIPADDQAPLRESVSFTLGGFTDELLVVGNSSPAELVFPLTGVIDFGVVEIGNHGFKTIVVENKGGETAELELDILPPFRAEIPGSTTGAVRGGGKTRVVLRMEAVHPGNFQRLLVAEWGNQRKEIPVQVVVKDPLSNLPPVITRNESWSWSLASAEQLNSVSKTPASSDSPRSNSMVDFSKLSSQEIKRIMVHAVVGLPVGPVNYSEKVAVAERPFLHEAGTDFLEIGVELPVPAPRGFILEQAEMVASSKAGAMEKRWSPCPKDTEIFRLDENTMVARIADLNPAAGYEFRVLCLGEGTATSYPSNVGHFNTVPERNVPWGWGVIAALFLGCGILYWRRRREEERYEEAPTQSQEAF